MWLADGMMHCHTASATMSDSIPRPIPFNFCIDKAVKEVNELFPGGWLVDARGYTRDNQGIDNIFDVELISYVTETLWYTRSH
jgi:hypothetical protein